MWQEDKFIFALIGGEINEEDKSFKVRQVVGTTFGIGNNYFLTANHVVELLKEYEFSALLKFTEEEGQGELFKISDSERIGDTDLAILNIPEFNSEDVGFLVWDGGYLKMFDDVFTIGFPFGFRPDKNEFSMRGYKGHVVSTTYIEQYPGIHYELSFSCPRGISGAPLMSPENGVFVGVIIGNKSTEIEVYRETETEDDGKVRNSYLKYEGIEYGLAISIDSVRDIKSRILNKTIFEYFEEVLKDPILKVKI